MDTQRALAVLWFLVLAALMGYASYRPKWAIAVAQKVYKLVGINLDFNERGKTVLKMVTRSLTVLFIIGALAIILFR